MSYPTLQTPQRPLPGAFLPTPAPSRYSGSGPSRQLFRTQSSSSVSQPESQGSAQPVGAALPMPQAQALQPVQRAAKTVNEVLRRDANFPELDNYVKRECCQLSVGAAARLICQQRASHPTMTSLRSWVVMGRGRPTNEQRCTIFQIRFSINTILRRSRR